MKTVFQGKVKILCNEKAESDYFKISFASAKIASCAKPGQFLQVRVCAGTEPLLRRPLSIHNAHKGRVTLLYEIAGKGTEILSSRKPGEYLDTIGPLGNGFAFCEQTSKRANEQTILLAGGMGVAPLVFLAEKLREIKNQKSIIKDLVLIGARTKSQILCEKEFKSLGYSVKIATDDGSTGFKGRVTALLEKILRANELTSKRANQIYACGPHPMLKEVSRISQAFNVPAQVSLEEHMACGIGACLGCVIKTKNGYQRVCKEGPVFKAKEIIW